MSLLDRVLDAHGGLDRWRAHEELDVHYRAGGLVFASRMRGLRMKPWHARVRLDRPHTTLEDYPEAGRRGVLDGEHVAIDGDGARDNPRELLRRSARRRVRWDDFDFLYFSGYAIWGYATFPFHLTLPGVHTEEIGERALHVRYPAGWPVHSREQTFHFDDAGLLVRNDYTAEVIGSWAHAVHLTLEHRTFDGLTFGTRRRVHPPATGKITLVKVAIDQVNAR